MSESVENQTKVTEQVIPQTVEVPVAPLLADPPPVAPTPTPVPVPPVKSAPEFVTPGLLYKVVFVVAILSSLLTVFAYDRVYATKIVVFDLQEYLTKIRTDGANNKLTPEQYKERLDVLESSVLSVPKNTIIITGDVILGKNAKKLAVPEK